ncbi:PASTA domain-containing protein, partial [Blattabacterium cuenoti]|uniref:PASTA domain-containing protein n=1 Tax=Blattabacterium cuenoti TaxID=1653831 RepID=UPI001EEC52D8
MYKITSVSLKWIDIYTKHGSYVIVPDLHSLTLEKSIILLKKLGLKYDIDTSRYDPSFSPYQVISFSPEAGDHVKKGRHIYIQANANANNTKTFPSTVVLPNIINKNKKTAVKLLHANHLLVKEIKYRNDISRDIVLKVFFQGNPIQSGSILQNQDAVTLLIGKGKKEYEVPNVIGMDLHTATSTLKSKSFNIINVYYENSTPQPSTSESEDDDRSENRNKKKVYRQNPYPGIKIQNNKSIQIWLTSNNDLLIRSESEYFNNKKKDLDNNKKKDLDNNKKKDLDNNKKKDLDNNKKKDLDNNKKKDLDNNKK